MGVEEGYNLEGVNKQKALLKGLLEVMRRQRKYLIESDLKGMEETNRQLADMLEAHRAWTKEVSEQEDMGPLWELARELQRESQANYVLACRGVEFARASIELMSEATEGRHGLLDRPA